MQTDSEWNMKQGIDGDLNSSRGIQTQPFDSGTEIDRFSKRDRIRVERDVDFDGQILPRTGQTKVKRINVDSSPIREFFKQLLKRWNTAAKSERLLE